MTYTHDVIVIGGGAAGLTAAGGCGLFGLKVALIEGRAMGGECLNDGCVPSKALIAAARRAAEARQATRAGVTLAAPQVDWAGVRAHIEGAIASIAPHDSEDRFEGMGCEVIRDHARFTGPHTVEVAGRELSAPRIVIATGSEPALPPIDGLAGVPYLTNETLFRLDALPGHLIVVGGGSIGMEMAQSFRALGSTVTLVEPEAILAKDDRESVALLVAAMEAEGVRFIHDKAASVTGQAGALVLTTGGGEAIAGTHLLIAAGRKARVTGYGLETTGVKLGANGIAVDARRRTSVSHIYAIGDCRDGPRLTHVAGHEGSNVVSEIALGVPAKADFCALPWCTYTSPEVAQVGLTEGQAREAHGRELRVVVEHFDHNDRAMAEGRDAGFCKLLLSGSKVVGASIVGENAGELLVPIAQTITGKAGSFAASGAIIAYPTRAEIVKAALFQAWEPTLFGKWPKRWAALVAKKRRLLG